MILYKYCSADMAKKILETNKVAFRFASDFNDPFELLSAYSHIDDGARRFFLDQNLVCSFLITCFSRTPVQPLMWAHYANDHKGVCIGFDVRADDFISESKNVVPVQFGSVVYTTNPPNKLALQNQPTLAESITHFDASNFDFIRKAFLQKSTHWAYEEEVRWVVKMSDAKVAELELELKGNKYLRKLPLGCIREVIYGVRYQDYVLDEGCSSDSPTVDSFLGLSQFVSGLNGAGQGDIKQFFMGLDTDSFDLIKKPLDEMPPVMRSLHGFSI